VIVLAGITVMMIMMGAAVPTWRYIMQDDREQELYFAATRSRARSRNTSARTGTPFRPRSSAGQGEIPAGASTRTPW
jgi:hypothetical protein